MTRLVYLRFLWMALLGLGATAVRPAIGQTVANVDPVPTSQAATGASEPSLQALLAQARAWIGSEEALRAVRTIHYQGTFENLLESRTGRFHIYLKKPAMQRTEFDDGTTTVTTAIDGFEGWSRVSVNGQTDNYRLKMLETEQLRRMRYNTHDNLNFFAGMEAIFGKIESRGRAYKDGFETWRIDFIFDDRNVFQRYFDCETGALVATTNLAGMTIRETGSQIVAGVRFPRVVDAYFNGEIVNRIVYQRIAVNEDLPDFLFEFPTIRPPRFKTDDGGRPVPAAQDVPAESAPAPVPASKAAPAP